MRGSTNSDFVSESCLLGNSALRPSGCNLADRQTSYFPFLISSKVIKRAPSRASRSSLANEGFFVFGGRPRRPLKLTDLPPTGPVAADESTAVEESIEEEGGGSAIRRIFGDE